MSLTKAQLVFDSTTPANGDAVASYLFATNRLTSAAVGGNESLRTIAALVDGAGTALTSTLVGAKQSLDVNVASFTATDLNVDGTVADGVADADNPVKIGYHAYVTLSATTVDKRVNAASDLYRRAYVNTSPNISGKQQIASVGVTAAVLITGALAGRRHVQLQNLSNQPVFIGFDNTVTADQTATGGMPIPGHGGAWDIDLGDNVALWAISTVAASKVSVTEVA